MRLTLSSMVFLPMMNPRRTKGGQRPPFVQFTRMFRARIFAARRILTSRHSLIVVVLPSSLGSDQVDQRALGGRVALNVSLCHVEGSVARELLDIAQAAAHLEH